MITKGTINHIHRQTILLHVYIHILYVLFVRKLSEVEHQHSLELSQLKINHLDTVRELEEKQESTLIECKSLQTQLEALEKSLQTQNTLLADKVKIYSNLTIKTLNSNYSLYWTLLYTCKKAWFKI